MALELDNRSTIKKTKPIVAYQLAISHYNAISHSHIYGRVLLQVVVSTLKSTT